MQILTSLFAFAVAIAVLVTVHEYGHFWAARRCGVRVLRFSIGFGRALWRHVGRDGVEYVLAAVPFGGYVKMLDEREGEVPEEELQHAFNRQPVWKRAVIVAAGPAFNFAFAIIAYWLIFLIGVPGVKPIVGEVLPGSYAEQAGVRPQDEIVAVRGEPTPTWEAVTLQLLEGVLADGDIPLEVRRPDGAIARLQLVVEETAALTEPGALMDGIGLRLWNPALAPVIGDVEPGGSAAQAGLQSGDRILSADGKPITEWGEWVEFVRARPGRIVELRIERNGAEREVSLVIGSVETETGPVGQIGARAYVPPELLERLRAELRYGPVAAAVAAFEKTWDVSALTLRMLGKMVVGEASLKNISGPINIAQYAGVTASIGLVPFLAFLAVISVSLGVLNLLPIPILDGGHLAYYLVELVKGSPVSARVEALGQQIGLFVLFLLMGLAVYNDLARLLD